MIPPELAALRASSLIAFARKHWTNVDPAKSAAARKAYTIARDGDPAKARRILAEAGVVPDAPTLIPQQPLLLDLPYSPPTTGGKHGND